MWARSYASNHGNDVYSFERFTEFWDSTAPQLTLNVPCEPICPNACSAPVGPGVGNGATTSRTTACAPTLPVASFFWAATRIVAVPYGCPPCQNECPAPSLTSAPPTIGGA